MFDKLAITLISPLGTSLTLGVVALLLARGRWGSTAWSLGGVALIWLWVWSLPLVSHALRGAIEAQYPALSIQALPSSQAIVVLGGSVTPPEEANQTPDLTSGADRVWHAARLFHAGKAPSIVLSGGINPPTRATSEAAAMRVFLTDLGVPAHAMLIEDNSRNTRQNAKFTAELLRSRKISHILLVTSAMHMHRAVALFEAQGLHVTPVATDHEAQHSLSGMDWLPDAGALDGSAQGLKEIVGRWVGR
jgi:uncharacterized SAM-binding protein YcdF (DUF218 family)